MMKKIITILVIALSGLIFVCGSASAKGQPSWTGGLGLQEGKIEGTANQAQNHGQAKKLEERIRVRGMSLKFDAPPVIKEGRTLVPVRAIMNGLGAEVKWDPETKTVTITRDDKTIVLNLVTGEVTVNEESVTIEVPAQLISNRTFVPLRFIAQTLGEKVEYDEQTGEIDIGEETAADSAGGEAEDSDDQ
ncbi:MAG: copper amine oxidase N-terminal domain-containing protein [Peptococcaceae bacterium]|jgi:hypothetical protein|nr:copper amine oxidase N-terminal domain-containing protein [Peptococcaceae bacterium]MDH7525206.1 copper amine oxidase N-terminal domain-containing protein [Peptococcaceae bacterium]